MIELNGKNALVTGGSRGIGAAVCRLLAQAGANVTIAYHNNLEAAEAVAGEVRTAGARAALFRGDLSRMGEAEKMFSAAKTAFGSVDMVIANAGIWKRAPIDEMTAEDWRQTMTANLDSVYDTCRQAAIHMKQQGSGNLILISSTAGQRGEAFYSHYAASKGALIAMTRSLAAELGPFNINVNSVAPGWVTTDMTTRVFSDDTVAGDIKQSIPLRRIASPEDIAGPVVFLCSDLARHVQGAVINVNGGSVLC